MKWDKYLFLETNKTDYSLLKKQQTHNYQQTFNKQRSGTELA